MEWDQPTEDNREELVRIMDNKNMNQVSFSKHIGVSVSYLNMILNKQRKPSYNFLLKLAKRIPDVNLKKVVLEAQKKES